MNNTPFYFHIVYFDSENPIKNYNDLLLNEDSCYVVYSRPYTTKKRVIEKAKKYDKVCIVYNAVNQTYLSDPRHAKYDRRLVNILFNWSQHHIPDQLMLETIPEEDEQAQASAPAQASAEEGLYIILP